MFRSAFKHIRWHNHLSSRALSIPSTRIPNSILSSGNLDTLPIIEDFSRRHIGPNEVEQKEMLEAIGVEVSRSFAVIYIC